MNFLPELLNAYFKFFGIFEMRALCNEFYLFKNFLPPQIHKIMFVYILNINSQKHNQKIVI